MSVIQPPAKVSKAKPVSKVPKIKIPSGKGSFIGSAQTERPSIISKIQM